jgi:hypothetical protein
MGFKESKKSHNLKLLHAYINTQNRKTEQKHGQEPRKISAENKKPGGKNKPKFGRECSPTHSKNKAFLFSKWCIFTITYILVIFNP